MLTLMRIAGMVAFLALTACGGSDSKPGSSSSSPSSVASSSSSSMGESSSSEQSLSSSSTSSVDQSSSSSQSSSEQTVLPVGTVDFLPALHIDTEGSAPIVTKEIYLPGTFSLSGEGIASAEGTLEIRGRGNSTWSWDKKPFRVRLTQATELMGMPASRHWVLLANYADKTLVRNDVAFMFSREIGMAYTPRNRHVELTLNGVYQGVYQLVEHIRVAPDRVNIPELKVGDTDVDRITGGYLIEIDFRMNKDFCLNPANHYYEFCQGGVNMSRNVDFCVDSSYGMEPYCLASPDSLLDPAWSAQRDYIENYIADMESALFGENFTDPELGYAAYLDVESTINYYILNELFKNPDGASASAYLHKDRGGKLLFGPVWDFDLSLGNAGYDDVDKTYGWHIRRAPIFERLFEDPAFDAAVKARWQTLKAEGKIEFIFEYAEARATWLDEAQARNFELWQIFDWVEWYTRVIMGSYAAEVAEMIRWQRERMEWMDAELSD